MARAHDLGPRGEEIAARHLQRLGYRILDRNYRLGHREIDLIVRRGDVIAFVEVKARAGDGYGHPFEAITALKRREIERVAKAWIQRRAPPATTYRFDAVAVRFRRGAPPVVEHVPGAWRVGE